MNDNDPLLLVFTPTMPSSRSASAVLKCPTCNTKHHPKTDVFCNRKGGHDDDDEDDGGDKCYNDYDARQIFGITSTCPITLEECSNLVVLPCGHVLSRSAYQSLGGYLPRISCSSSRVSIDDGSNISDDDDDTDGGSSSILVHIRHAGQAGVNGTYRRHYNKINSDSSNNNNNTNNANRYTSIGRYDNQDVEYCIDLRTVTTGNGNTKRMWYLSCRPLGTMKNNPTTSNSEPFKVIDFYKGRVNECMYPHHILWEPASLLGTYPAPRSAISHFA